MAYTISVHNGKQANRKHNNRDKETVSKERHINPEKPHYNALDVSPIEAYRRIFGKVLEEYNNHIKDKHPERVKTIEQFYNEIMAKRDNSKNSRKGVYEVIIQVGNTDQRPSDKELYRIYMEYAKTWKERNKNLKMIGCYLHFDEPGGPHMHIDYVPVAHCKRGMALQPNINKALEEMGFKTKNYKDNSLVQWERSERAVMEQICKEMEIETKPAVGGKKHKHKQIWELEQKLDRTYKQLDNELQKLEELEIDVNCLEETKKKLENQIKTLKQELLDITKPTTYKENLFISEIDLDDLDSLR